MTAACAVEKPAHITKNAYFHGAKAAGNTHFQNQKQKNSGAGMPDGRHLIDTSHWSSRSRY